jgi:hypothetical protein
MIVPKAAAMSATAMKLLLLRSSHFEKLIGVIDTSIGQDLAPDFPP